MKLSSKNFLCSINWHHHDMTGTSFPRVISICSKPYWGDLLLVAVGWIVKEGSKSSGKLNIYNVYMGDYINKGAKLWHGLFSNCLLKYHSKSTMSFHIIMCWSGFLKILKPEIVWRILWFITLQNPLIYRIFYIHSVTWTPKEQKGCYTDYYNPFWS